MELLILCFLSLASIGVMEVILFKAVEDNPPAVILMGLLFV